MSAKSAATRADEAVRTTTLDNGLRVVTATMDGVESASLGVWVETGARHETPDVNGVSHFLEHMAFKGTESRDALAIASEIEAVGGHLNAYTSRENTAYYAKVLADDVPLGVDLVADILQNSIFDPTELERERAVILQEIHQTFDTPDDLVFDYFQEAAFPDQALGRPVLGTVDTVTNLSRDTIKGYMDARYGGPVMVLSAAGKVDHDAMVALAEEKFNGLRTAEKTQPDPFAYKGGDWREEKKLEQAHVLLGLDGIGFNDPDFYAASVFATLFGGGMSSRLFQEVREKRGLAYSIYAFLSAYDDGGLFGIYAGTGGDDLEELIPVLCGELERAAGDISEDEINRARNQLKASVLMGLESSSSRCEQMARQMIVFGRTVGADELRDKIAAVDGAAVQRVIERLAASRPTLTGLGPISKLESYDKVAARLS